MKKVDKEIKNCLNCDNIFSSYESKKQKFCSYKCAMNFRKGKKRPPFSVKWRKNIGDKSKGRHPIKEFRKGNTKSPNAYKFPKGESHPNWQGGKSFEPYTVDWKITLKKSIRERDHYLCGLCGLPQDDEALSVHHIDYDKKNCNPDNLISLHRKCHIKTNKNRNYWKSFFEERIPRKS